ncbi:4Fe-4S binding protein [Candidatus Bathyarchaeota archaeon]|nr:4Fe-4S binding protein [Candidatus Bathyarchaeota archaeon]
MKANIRRRLLKINTLRRVVQLLSFLLFSAMVFNLDSLPIVLPVLWSWGYQPNTLGDAFTALQLMFSGWRLPSVVFPWFATASFLLVGVLIGKSLCGWVCPFGFIQDLVGFVKVKKTEVSPKTHRNMALVKYFVLGIVLFISLTFSAAKLAGAQRDYERALGIFAYAPFTAISPAETLFSSLPRGIQSFSIEVTERPIVDVLSGILDLPTIFWAQLFILVGVLVLAAYVPRGWCRYLCPHGAIMAFLNKFSFLGLRRDPVKCVKGECRECVKACPMMVPILELPWEKFSDPECIYCMKCSDTCPHKAIRLKYP